MSKIENSYLNYLSSNKADFDSGKRIFSSKNREILLNEKYLYPVIVSNYFGEKIISVTPDYFEEIKNIEKKTKNIDEIIDVFLKNHAEYQIRKMHRFVAEEKLEIKQEVKPLTKELVYKIDFGKEFDHKKYFERKQKIIEEKRQFVILERDKIASMAFISEIVEGNANIVVVTLEGYRGKGYAGEVVKACVNWCIDRDVVPVYLVEDTNEASKKIPKKLGFKKLATEWIISK